MVMSCSIKSCDMSHELFNILSPFPSISSTAKYCTQSLLYNAIYVYWSLCVSCTPLSSYSRAPSSPWQCPDCHRQTRRSKTSKKAFKDEMAMCMSLLQEMEEKGESWPFLQPVDRKKVPEYFKVIKNPMDFQTVRTKLRDGKWVQCSRSAFFVFEMGIWK